MIISVVQEQKDINLVVSSTSGNKIRISVIVKVCNGDCPGVVPTNILNVPVVCEGTVSLALCVINSAGLIHGHDKGIGKRIQSSRVAVIINSVILDFFNTRVYIRVVVITIHTRIGTISTFPAAVSVSIIIYIVCCSRITVIINAVIENLGCRRIDGRIAIIAVCRPKRTVSVQIVVRGIRVAVIVNAVVGNLRGPGIDVGIVVVTIHPVVVVVAICVYGD